MNTADIWLHSLARRDHSDKQGIVADELFALLAELQRCAEVFNFHTSQERKIKVFLHVDAGQGADVIFSRAKVEIKYERDSDDRNKSKTSFFSHSPDLLHITLFTVADFAEQEREKERFSPCINDWGILYWQNEQGHKLSNDMIIRHIFEQLMAHAQN